MDRRLAFVLVVVAALAGSATTYIALQSATRDAAVEGEFERGHRHRRAGRRIPDAGVESRLEEPREAPGEGDSVVVVTWDTVRADHVSAYGYPRPTTPHLDALAARGVLFENFVVPQSTTLPTHVSLFTGAHPDAHGVTGNSASGARRFIPPPGLVPMARHLANAGYRTAGFVSSTPLKTHSGIAEGFQDWSEPKRRWRGAEHTTARAVEWLQTVPSSEPVFLWVHVYDPHAPYTLRPESGAELGDPGVLRPWLALRGVMRAGRVPDGIIELNHRYDSEIHHVDRQLGVLLEALDAAGRADAVVAVVGDHGEGLGQHRHKEHGLVWEEQLRAPLVVKAPGIAPTRIAALATAQDFLPVLAGVATLPDEAGLLAGGSGHDARTAAESRPVLSRTSRRQLRELRQGGSQVMAWSLHTDEDQLIYRVDGNHSLYIRQTDPFARTDRAAEMPTRVAERVETLVALRQAHEERAAALGAGQTEPLSAELIEELEALGYAE